ncbi:chemotaxis protein, partial [Haloferax sp. Atlit-24N]
SFDGIVERVEDTTASVHEISDATSSQADSSQEVLSMTDEIAGISEETTAEAQNVSAAAEQQTAALDGVNQDVRELSTNVNHLDELLDAFEVGDESDVSSTGNKNGVSSTGNETDIGPTTDDVRSADDEAPTQQSEPTSKLSHEQAESVADD